MALNLLIGNRVRESFQFEYNFDNCPLFLGDGWSCQGVESGTKFGQIDLSENKEWMDYDEKTKEAVAINELQFKFVKVK